MTKLCMFDMDGTLLNTLENIGGNMNETLTEFSLAPYPIEDYRYFVGNGSRVLTERVLAGRGKNTPAFFEPFFEKFSQTYAMYPDRGVTVYDGILPLLAALKEREVLVAVCTNKPQAAAERSMRIFFDPDSYTDLLGGRAGVPLKPAPDAPLALMEKYGVTREETLFIGDSDVDMETAVALGVRGLGALWGFRTAEELTKAGAHALLAHPLDVLKFI